MLNPIGKMTAAMQNSITAKERGKKGKHEKKTFIKIYTIHEGR